MLHILRNYQKLLDLICMLRKENDTLRKSNTGEAELQRQAEKAKSANNMLNYRIGKLQDTVKNLHAEIERRDATNAELKRTIEQLRDEIADLHRKHKVLRIADHIR
jgi:phage shock protein A